jgi:hypothetical protein
MLRWVIAFACAAALGACSSMGSAKVQGNESGGIVGDIVKNEQEQIQLANEHCRNYGKATRITATQKDSSGRVIFVCETAAPPAPPPPPAQKGKRQ